MRRGFQQVGQAQVVEKDGRGQVGGFFFLLLLCERIGAAAGPAARFLDANGDAEGWDDPSPCLSVEVA